MLLRLRIVVCIALVLVAGLWVSAACAAMNQPDDVSVALGVVALLACFVVFPWLFMKLLRSKGKVNA